VAAGQAGLDEVVFPADTAIGSLIRYVTTPQREFAPMNATWGLFPRLEDSLQRTDRRSRARSHLAQARVSYARFLASRPDLVAARGAMALAQVP
jgi:methylenetetrahydrofolate--tRNA-(uracil-5-)-methyltransferase